MCDFLVLDPKCINLAFVFTMFRAKRRKLQIVKISWEIFLRVRREIVRSQKIFDMIHYQRVIYAEIILAFQEERFNKIKSLLLGLIVVEYFRGINTTSIIKNDVSIARRNLSSITVKIEGFFIRTP